MSLHARLLDGYHVNSDQPADKYLIPLKLSWEAAPLVVEAIHFPAAERKRYSFSDQPLSVFASDFDIKTDFRAPAEAPAGRRTITGSLRYQACSDNLCLPPKTIDVELVIDIR